jgi:hypothetical protein
VIRLEFNPLFSQEAYGIMARRLRDSKRTPPHAARLIVITAALMTLCALAPSNAQEAQDKAIGGAEHLLSTFGIEPSVATYGRGGFVIVWTNSEPGDFGIRGALLVPGAVDPGIPFAVNTGPGSEQNNPSVSADSSGRFVVVWQSADSGGATLTGQRYGAGGVKQGTELALTSSNHAEIPKGAMADNGAFDVGWVDLRDSFRKISAARFSANGVPQGGEIELPALGIVGNDNAQIVHYPGGFAVGWDEIGSCGVCPAGERSFNAAVNRFDDSGARVGRTYRLSAGANTNPGFGLAGLASSRAGALAVFSAPNGFSGQRFAPSGQPVGGLFPIRRQPLCQGLECQVLRAVAMDDNGRFALVWEKSDGLDVFNLTAQLYSAANKPRGGLEPVNLTLSIQPEAPAAALANDGSLVVVWSRVDPFQSVPQLFARRLRLP